MLAGVFPVRIPRSKNSFAAGEIFIFLLLLLHGPAAATLAAAGEALVGSWRTSKRWTSRIASPAMAAHRDGAAGSLLDRRDRHAARSRAGRTPPVLLVGDDRLALVYFVINTLLITAGAQPQAQRAAVAVSELFGNFGWIGIAYAAAPRWRHCCS